MAENFSLTSISFLQNFQLWSSLHLALGLVLPLQWLLLLLLFFWTTTLHTRRSSSHFHKTPTNTEKTSQNPKLGTRNNTQNQPRNQKPMKKTKNGEKPRIVPGIWAQRGGWEGKFRVSLSLSLYGNRWSSLFSEMVCDCDVQLDLGNNKNITIINANSWIFNIKGLWRKKKKH